MTDAADNLVLQRISIVKLLGVDEGDPRPCEPTRLLSWLLTGDPSAKSLRHAIAPSVRLDALAVVARLGGFDDMIGSTADLTSASQELMGWLESLEIRPIPRHYKVSVFLPSEEAQLSAKGWSNRPCKQVRVKNRPAKWWSTSTPEDAI